MSPRGLVVSDAAWAAAAWHLGVLALKVTALLGLAAVLALVAGRRSAAARHLIWATALGATLVLPALAALTPRRAPEVSAGWRPWGGTARSDVTPPATARAGNRGSVALPPRSDTAPLPPARPPATGATAAGGRAVWNSLRARLEAGQFAAALVGVWALGTAGLLAVLARSFAARTKLGRAQPVGSHAADAAVRHALARVAGEVGVRRAVRLRWERAGAVPMTWGVRRPVLLLPADAATWPAAQLDAVLRHELAHVRRGDAAWGLVAEFACALFWPHPGVWLARAARARWQEHAADALAVASGAERHAYAAALVGVAGALSGHRRRGAGAAGGALAATAFVRRSALTARLRALTAPAFVPAGCTPAQRATILAGVAGGAFAVAPLGGPWGGAGAAGRADALRGPAPLVRQPHQGPDSVASATIRPHTAPLVAAGRPSTPQVADALLRVAGSHGATRVATSPAVAAAVQPAGHDPRVLALYGVAPDFARDLAAAGLRDLSTDTLVLFWTTGVRAPFVRALRDAGLAPSATEVLPLWTHGVRPADVAALRDAGLRATPEQVVKLRDYGVPPAYVRAFRDAAFPVTADQAVTLWTYGVHPDLVGAARRAGFTVRAPEDLVDLKNYGVVPDSVRALRAAGLPVTRVAEAVALHTHGVTPGVAAALARAGHRGLSPDAAIALYEAGALAREQQ